MDIYYRKQRWKLLLFLFAAIIGISSLLYTNQLVRELSREERKKIELWAEATRLLVDPNTVDLGFPLLVLEYNTTIPVMIVEGDTIIGSRNIDSLRTTNPRYMYRQLDKMKKKNPSIPIVLEGGYTQYLYYLNSTLLRRLTWYPYIQLGIILLFILVSYLAFSASRKAEQNQVWVGLSKETAHQLGTPTSAMLGWVEILREKHLDQELVSELGKDADRLEKITERFSKIGSRPVLKPENIMEVVSESVEYLRSRTSELVVFELDKKETDCKVPLNRALFGWVIENVCKNAVDAIEGNGRIRIGLSVQEKMVHLDIRDSGKGIPKKYHKTIFKPGYTTKQRGWGLGLSLAKRIIESYHQGKIYILQSDTGKGTTMRISLNK